jgi:hypothetical protein
MPFPHAFLGDQKIWSPSDNGGVSNGNQKHLVAIKHTPTIRWQLKIFDYPKGKAWDDF